MKIQNRRTIPEEWFKRFKKLMSKDNISYIDDIRYYIAFYNDGTTPEQLFNECKEYDERQEQLYLSF